MHNKLKTIIPAAALAALATGVVVGQIGSTAQATGDGAQQVSVDPALETLYEPLAEDQRPKDELPEFLQSGPQAFEEVDPDTSRLAGSDDGIKYWVAVNRSNEACLIALLPGPAEMTSMSCSDADDLAERGISLQFADADTAMRAYIVPAGYEIDDSTEDSLDVAGDQLLTGSSEDPIDEVPVAPSDDLTPGQEDVLGEKPPTIELPAFDALQPGAGL